MGIKKIIPKFSEFLAEIKSGDRHFLSKALTFVESTRPEDQKKKFKILSNISAPQESFLEKYSQSEKFSEKRRHQREKRMISFLEQRLISVFLNNPHVLAHRDTLLKQVRERVFSSYEASEEHLLIFFKGKSYEEISDVSGTIEKN